MYCVQLYQLKRMVRQEMMTGVPDRFCEVIEDNAAIRWEEAGEEFSMNGDWYDVVAIKRIHGKTYFYCLNDRKEAQLVKKFASLIASRPANDPSGHTVVKFHITDQYVLNRTPLITCMVGLKDYYDGRAAYLPCVYEAIQLPPPRC